MKPLVYLQILDSSLRYLAVHPRNHGILDRGEIVFDLEILSDRQITNVALLQSRLDALVREKKWRQAKAYVLLINDFVVIKEESVPAQLNEDEVRDYLRLQMNDAIRIPFENPVFDYDLLERDEEEQKLVLVAYPGDSIEDYKKILQGARLRPEVADVASLSLYRLAGRQGLISSEAGEHNLILQLEPYSMNMTMFHRDQPTFSRDSYSEVLAEMWEQDKDGWWQWLRTDAERELMLNDQFDELERFLNFYTNSILRDDGQISQFVLTGSYPDLDFAREVLAERFSLVPQLPELPQGLEQPYAALYGLSLKDKTERKKKEKKTKVKAGAKDKVKAQQQAEKQAKAEAQVQSVVVPKAEPAVEVQARTQAEPKAELRAVAEPQARAQAETKAELKTETRAKSKRQAKAEAKAKQQAEKQAKAEAEAQAKAEAEAKKQAEKQAKAEAKAKKRARTVSNRRRLRRVKKRQRRR